MWSPHFAQCLLENPEIRCATDAAKRWNARVRPWRSNSTYHCHTLEILFCAEEDMDMEGLAASRMEALFRMYLACSAGTDGQM